MAKSYILPVVFVIVPLLLVSFVSSDATPSFTFMNFFQQEDFVTVTCECVDVGGNVSTLIDTVGNCIDKEYPAAVCPNGVATNAIYCYLKYYQRDRTKSPISIAPWYANLLVWTSTGPNNTYYQLNPTDSVDGNGGVFGATVYQYFSPGNVTDIGAWNALEFPSSVFKATTVGNGWSF
ncbi:unnamed protein product [Calypogeia fissa]